MFTLAALVVGGLLELASAVLLLDGARLIFSLLLHLLSAALVLAAFLRSPAARQMGALAATLALLFPVFGLPGAVLVLLTARPSPGEKEAKSLLREFSDYVMFKGYWGERRRFGRDISRELAREAAVQPLVDMVTDSSVEVRRAGIRAAGSIGDGVSLAALRTLAVAPETVLRYSAAKELELLEDKWLAEVSAADEDSRRQAADPAPCQRSARLYADGAEVSILGRESSRYLRDRAIEAWRDYRRRGGDAAESVPAEARLLMLNGRHAEAVELVLAHPQQGALSPAAELLKAEVAAAAGNHALLREQVQVLRAGPATPEVSAFLAFLGTP